MIGRTLDLDSAYKQLWLLSRQDGAQSYKSRTRSSVHAFNACARAIRRIGTGLFFAALGKLLRQLPTGRLGSLQGQCSEDGRGPPQSWGLGLLRKGEEEKTFLEGIRSLGVVSDLRHLADNEVTVKNREFRVEDLK